MTAALKSEFRKLFSTRMWWILMICAAAYLAFMGLLMAFSFQFGTQELSDLPPEAQEATGLPRGAAMARMIYSMAGSFAYIFPLLIGALSITQEYRHKTITPTFLAEPRRYVVLGAKLVASLPMGFVYGLVCVAATALPAALVLEIMGGDAGLGQTETWAFFGRALLDFTVWASVGVGLGSLITNQVALIVVVLAETQAVEPILRMLPPMIGQDWTWTDYLPGAVGDAIQGASLYSLMGMDTGAMPWGWALLILLGWAVALAGLGYAFQFRRDVS
ncbi:MAG: ABC transporter permease [Bifidobacteriaceae bacterium]|nr:ABC transporter permease [Bifidobacteriaceae bacterium]